MYDLMMDKEKIRSILDEIAQETAKIKKASQKYTRMINVEYQVANLHFLKELMDMFGELEDKKGIGFLAGYVDTIRKQVNEIFDEYCVELDRK